MKTLKLFFLSVLAFLQFGSQVIRYALIFASAFLRQRASLGFELDIWCCSVSIRPVQTPSGSTGSSKRKELTGPKPG